MFGFTGSFTTSATVLLLQVISRGAIKRAASELHASDFLDAAATVVRKQILKGYLNLHVLAIIESVTPFAEEKFFFSYINSLCSY